MKDNLSIQEQLIRKIELLRHRIGEMEKSESKHKEEGHSLNKAREELEEHLVRRSVELSRINVDLQDEIKERKRAQAEIGALKKQIEFILGASKTGLDIIDSDYNMVYIDPEWQKVYGEYKGKKCYQYFMGRKNVCPDCGVTKALETKKTVVTEEFLAKEGNRPIQVTTIPFQDEKGDWLVAEVNVDITESKRAEGVIKASEEKYRALYESSRDAIMQAHPDKGFLGCNPATIKMFKCKDEAEFVSKSPADLSPKSQADGSLSTVKAQEMMKIAMEKGTHFFEWTHRRIDGSDFPATVLLTRMKLKGEVLLQATVRDISESKKSQEKIKIFSDAVAIAFNCFFLTDLKGNITYVNASACATFGYTLDEFLKLTTADLDVDPKFAKKIRQGLMEKGKWSGEVTNIRKNKETFHSLLSVYVIMDEKGSPKWTMGILRDITEHKKMEQEIFSLARFPAENPSPVLRITREGEVLYSNEAGLKLLAKWNTKVGGKVPELWCRLIKEKFDSGKTGLEEEEEEEEVKGKAFLCLIAPIKEAGYANLYFRNITERKRTENLIDKANKCFLSFSHNPEENIRKIVESVGSILDGACALYNKEKDALLCTIAGWNIPKSLKRKDDKLGHICYDVITRQKDEPFVINDLNKTPYAQTDPNVAKYNLKTYIGCAVKMRGKAVGSLCVVYQNNRIFDINELKILSVFSKALGIEEWRKSVEEELKDSERKLCEDKLVLAQKNLALKELIEHMERTKNKTKEDISINAGELIMPILKKLRLKGVSPKYIKLLEHNLKELTSSFGAKISQRSTKLTSREIEICGMIKGGLESKEISELLNVSCQTVEKHRKNIRKKLGLSRKKANLASHLQGL